jgi:hypothetical protein
MMKTLFKKLKKATKGKVTKVTLTTKAPMKKRPRQAALPGLDGGPRIARLTDVCLEIFDVREQMASLKTRDADLNLKAVEIMREKHIAFYRDPSTGVVCHLDEPDKTPKVKVTIQSPVDEPENETKPVAEDVMVPAPEEELPETTPQFEDERIVP